MYYENQAALVMVARGNLDCPRNIQVGSMNDPHVVALIYKIEHGPSVDYRKAESIDHEEAGFRVKIENDQVRFEFKEHYATEDAARKAIEDYIRVWEFSACLENGPSYFKLIFDHAQIEDRNPTPGVLMFHAPPARFEVKVEKATGVVSPAYYPPPLSGVKITPDVQLMYDRYMDHLQGREKLLDVAYFCWTMVKDNPVTTTDFSRGVCNTISRLSGGGGGPEHARKKAGIDKDPLTDQELRFFVEAIKAIIRRAAERAHDPDHNLPQISMSDLPPV